MHEQLAVQMGALTTDRSALKADRAMQTQEIARLRAESIAHLALIDGQAEEIERLRAVLERIADRDAHDTPMELKAYASEALK
jgi:hypothetical protein